MADVFDSIDTVGHDESEIIQLLIQRSSAVGDEERATIREKYLRLRPRIVKDKETPAHLIPALDEIFEVGPENLPAIKSTWARIGDWVQRTLFHFGP